MDQRAPSPRPSPIRWAGIENWGLKIENCKFAVLDKTAPRNLLSPALSPDGGEGEDSRFMEKGRYSILRSFSKQNRATRWLSSMSGAGFRGLGMAILLLTLSVLTGRACSVPVFRYALERWPASPYEAVVFHRGPLAGSAQALVTRLSGEVFTNAAPANISVQTVDLAAQVAPEMLELWKTHQDSPLPMLVLRYPQGAPAQGEVWSGPLDTNSIAPALDSPLRRRVAQRLLKGDCGVWVLLESGDQGRDNAAASLLQTRLAYLEKAIQLPKLDPDDIANRVISAAESELKVAFSSMRLGRADPAEQVFIRMLLGSEEDLKDQKEPIAFLIFGRGRALFALVGKGINDEMIDEACFFLTGPCSCVVKEQNPGMDMLMAVDWDNEIQPLSSVAEEPPPLTGLTALAQASNTTGATAANASRSNPAPTTSFTNAKADSLVPPGPTNVLIKPALLAGFIGLLVLAGGTIWLSRRKQ